jgi:hypothetical protein
MVDQLSSRCMGPPVDKPGHSCCGVQLFHHRTGVFLTVVTVNGFRLSDSLAVFVMFLSGHGVACCDEVMRDPGRLPDDGQVFDKSPLVEGRAPRVSR